MNKIYTSLQNIVLALVLLSILVQSQHLIAQTNIAVWSFEPLQGTNSNPTANIGTGTASLVIGSGTITGGVATGVSGASCGAQTSGTSAWALNPFNSGTANEINGVEFSTSTIGYSNIAFVWDQRMSNTSANSIRLKYSTDNGVTWNDFIMSNTNTTFCLGSINSNGCFEAANASGDQYRRVSVNLSSVTALNNAPNVKFRLLAAHFQNTGQFRQTNANTAVATAGTWRFDNVSIVSLPSTLPEINLSVNTNTAAEATNTVVTLTATAYAPVTGNHYVSVNVTGTGITTGDYTLSKAQISIPDGSTTGTMTFTIVDDSNVEGTEVATIALANPSWGFTLGATSSSDITITDNDAAPNTAPTIFIDVNATDNSIDGAVSSSPLSPYAVCASFNDPTDALLNQGIAFMIDDAETTASALIFSATSGNTAVVSNSNLALSGTGATRFLKITPSAIGYTTITVSVSDGIATTNYILNYAVSASSLSATTRFHSGSSDGSTAVEVDANYMFIGDDENQSLRLYHRNNSGLPVAAFDFSSSLGLSVPNIEVDIESSLKVGNRIYWIGSHGNSTSGALRPDRNRFFATDLSGTGANTVLNYVGRFDNLRSDLLNWDATNIHGLGANYFGLVASAANGIIPEDASGAGFNIEGLTIAPTGNAAYICFRAPIVPAANRTKALIVPWLNFSSLVTSNPTSGTAIFGTPIQLDLGGRGIREIKQSSSGEYLIIAGPCDAATGIAPKDFKLYTWTGNANDIPELRSTDLTNLQANGSFEGIVEVPSINAGTLIQLIVDNGDYVYYNDGISAKSLPNNNHKKSRSEMVSIGNIITLPISLIHFDGKADVNGVNLQWKIADAKNFSHFEIEHSTNDNFILINKTAYKSTSYQYQIKDLNPNQGFNYYRLKLVDLDGTFQYSNIIAVNFDTNKDKLVFYPNPVNDILYFNHLKSSNDIISIEIIDFQGKTMLKIENAIAPIDVKDIPTGVYIIKTLKNDELIPELYKIVVERGF